VAVTSRQLASGKAPPDWSVQYRPSSAWLLTCSRHGCGAKYLDDDPGRQAHIAVFGHSPRTSQPASPPKENP
jgi:hypothetical protein